MFIKSERYDTKKGIRIINQNINNKNNNIYEIIILIHLGINLDRKLILFSSAKDIINAVNIAYIIFKEFIAIYHI